ncbi:unnamed protein product, partial [marine sediment metagenome]
SFWYYMEASPYRGPLLELRFISPDCTDPDGAGHVDITVDTAEIGPTEGSWVQEAVTSSSSYIFFGNNADGSAFSGGAATLGGVAAAINAASTYTDVALWELVRVQVQLGWFYGGGTSTAYIDDIIIEGVTYALEEGDTIGTITIVFPEDFDITAVTNTLSDDDVTVGASSGIGTIASAATDAASVISTTTNDDDTLTIKVPNDIGAGATVQVVVSGVVNADDPDDDYTLWVSTSAETDAVESEEYEIVVPTVGVLPGVVELYNPSGILMDADTGSR